MFDFFLVAAAFVLGAIVGLASVGIGVLGTPALILLFHVSPAAAASAELAQGAVMKWFGALKHARQKTVEFSSVVWFLVLGVPLSMLGAYVSRGVDPSVLRRLIGLTLVLVSSLLLAGLLSLRLREQAALHLIPWLQSRKRAVSIGAGGIIGFLVGLTSIGSGSLMILVMAFVLQLPPATAVGTNLLVGAFLVSAGALSHASFGAVDWSLVANLLAGSIPGVWIGSHLAPRVNPFWLRVAVGVLVFAAGIQLALAS